MFQKSVTAAWPEPTLGDVGIATRVNGTAPPDVPLSDVDLGAWKFWVQDDDFRDGAFATLRREAPISFHPPLDTPGVLGGPGHWAVTRHDDVWYASRHPHIFSSRPSITINDANPDISEFFGSMIVMDDPRHLRLRNIVSRAFTPKVVARTEVSVRDRARRLVETMIAENPDGTGEAVAELAGPLPLQVICDMMGIPEEDHLRIFHWTNVILGFGDKDIATVFEEFLRSRWTSARTRIALAEDRRDHPRDDLAPRWCRPRSTASGSPAPRSRRSSSCSSSQATRPPATRSATACCADPPSRPAATVVGRLRGDGTDGRRGDRAVGVAGDLHAPHLDRGRRVGGAKMAAGDKVTLWYCSANRDEDQFADP